MTELRLNSSAERLMPSPRELIAVISDIDKRARCAQGAELQLLRRYNYRQLAHQFAEQLRLEEKDLNRTRAAG